MDEIKKDEKPVVVKKETPKVAKKTVILKNVAGEDVKDGDYFFSTGGAGKGEAPATFNQVCGLPVNREDLIEIFNKTFDPRDNFLFYKTTNKEVYVVIVPLRFSTSVGSHNESVDGDFQKHAISFVSEGSVNADTLKMKLKRILPFVKTPRD